VVTYKIKHEIFAEHYYEQILRAFVQNSTWTDHHHRRRHFIR